MAAKGSKGEDGLGYGSADWVGMMLLEVFRD